MYDCIVSHCSLHNVGAVRSNVRSMQLNNCWHWGPRRLRSSTQCAQVTWPPWRLTHSCSSKLVLDNLNAWRVVSMLQELAAVLLTVFHVTAYTTLSPAEFHSKLVEGFFGALIDTRSESEWNGGHLPNATFIQNLHLTGDTTLITGCERCRLAIYCHSGSRSKTAASRLESSGFSNVYDAQGIVQWQQIGQALVGGSSHVPPCRLDSTTCQWPRLSPTPTPLPAPVPMLVPMSEFPPIPTPEHQAAPTPEPTPATPAPSLASTPAVPTPEPALPTPVQSPTPNPAPSNGAGVSQSRRQQCNSPTLLVFQVLCLFTLTRY